jgi:hypothetical protein
MSTLLYHKTKQNDTVAYATRVYCFGVAERLHSRRCRRGRHEGIADETPSFFHVFCWELLLGCHGRQFKAAWLAVYRGTVPQNNTGCRASFSIFDSLVPLLASPQIVASAACTNRGHRSRKRRQSLATKCR